MTAAVTELFSLSSSAGIEKIEYVTQGWRVRVGGVGEGLRKRVGGG